MAFREAVDYAVSRYDVCLIPYELADGMEQTRRILNGVQRAVGGGPDRTGGAVSRRMRFSTQKKRACFRSRLADGFYGQRQRA